MPPTHHNSRTRFAAILFVFCGILSACSQPSPTAALPTLTSSAVSQAAPVPSPTPVPSLAPARVLFVSLDSASLDSSGPDQAIQAALDQLAGPAGMLVDQRSALTEADLDAGVKLVVIRGVGLPDANLNLNSLAANHPEIQFFAVDVAGVTAGNNVSVIGGDDQQAQVAFLAGYIAAITTPDWRTGVLSLADPSGLAVRDAFLNGTRYLCGICLPKYPPYPGYPVFAEAASTDGWQAAVDELKTKGVKTVYIYPPLASPEIMDALTQAGMRLIGVQAPPKAIKAAWTATIQIDPIPVIKSLWPERMAGKAGQQVNAPLGLSDVDTTLLTTGRLRLVDQVAQDLVGGWIAVDNP